jgi:hypothetical protein
MIIQPTKTITSLIGEIETTQQKTIHTGFNNSKEIGVVMREEIMQYHEAVKSSFPNTPEFMRILNDGYNVLMESLYNAILHGAKNTNDVSRALFIGSLGFAQGFFDGGDFFKQTGVEKYFEKEGPKLESSNIPEYLVHAGGNAGAGMSSIKAFSDYIDIDQKQGILYAINLVNKN